MLEDPLGASVESHHSRALELIRSADPSPAVDPVPPPPLVAGPVLAAHGSGSYPPAVTSSDLCADTVAAALPARGCLLVRDLLDATVTGELVEGIDRTFDEFDDWVRAPVDTPSGPWFAPFRPEERSVQMTRPALRAGGGVLTADSPRMFSRWQALVRSIGLYDLVTELFGEPPVSSLTKGTLRRVASGHGIEWHQDGAFLGIDSGALNVWVSLSDTTRSRGLDVVARRFDEIVPAGTHGAAYDWSVGDGLVAELAIDAPIERPAFAPGDALIFDGLLLHRTAAPPVEPAETRYAIETWFFRPSRFPPHQEFPLAM